MCAGRLRKVLSAVGVVFKGRASTAPTAASPTAVRRDSATRSRRTNGNGQGVDQGRRPKSRPRRPQDRTPRARRRLASDSTSTGSSAKAAADQLTAREAHIGFHFGDRCGWRAPRRRRAAYCWPRANLARLPTSDACAALTTYRRTLVRHRRLVAAAARRRWPRSPPCGWSRHLRRPRRSRSLPPTICLPGSGSPLTTSAPYESRRSLVPTRARRLVVRRSATCLRRRCARRGGHRSVGGRPIDSRRLRRAPWWPRRFGFPTPTLRPCCDSGDHIDVYAAVADVGQPAAVVAADVVVIAVPEPTEVSRQPGAVVVLAATPDQAARLAGGASDERPGGRHPAVAAAAAAAPSR